MKKLEIAIPEWNIRRLAKITLDEDKNKEYLSIKGIDTNNEVFDFMKNISVNNEAISRIPLKDNEKKDGSMYKFSMGFHGFYGEPKLEFAIPR